MPYYQHRKFEIENKKKGGAKNRNRKQNQDQKPKAEHLLDHLTKYKKSSRLTPPQEHTTQSSRGLIQPPMLEILKPAKAAIHRTQITRTTPSKNDKRPTKKESRPRKPRAARKKQATQKKQNREKQKHREVYRKNKTGASIIVKIILNIFHITKHEIVYWNINI